VRCSRRSATFEVARRTYYRQLLHRPQGYGDHVTLQRVAQANAGIESTGDDIAEIVVDRDIERDLRVALAERAEVRLNQSSVRDVAGVDAQQPMWAFGEISSLQHRITNLSQSGRERVEQFRPGLGERDTAGRAVDRRTSICASSCLMVFETAVVVTSSSSDARTPGGFLIDVPRENMRVLSIGTGTSTFTVDPDAQKGGVAQWVFMRSFNAAARAQSKNALGQAFLLLGKPNVARIDPPETDRPIAMDDVDLCVPKTQSELLT
jgi:hypothetical protein